MFFVVVFIKFINFEKVDGCDGESVLYVKLIGMFFINDSL